MTFDLRIVLTGAGVGWCFLDTRCRGHRSVDPREPLFPSVCQQPSKTLYPCALYAAVTCSPLPRALNIHRAGKLRRNRARSPLARYLLLGKISLVVVNGTTRGHLFEYRNFVVPPRRARIKEFYSCDHRAQRGFFSRGSESRRPGKRHRAREPFCSVTIPRSILSDRTN